MRFEVTPEEAQPTAMAMIRHFRRHKMTVSIEKPAWPAAPYRTTLVASKAGLRVLVEVQGTLRYARSLKDLAAWLANNRHYAQLYLAAVEDAVLQAGDLREMRGDGVGLFLASEDGVVVEQQRARNHALVISPDPTLAFGTCKHEVQAAVYKFNDGDRRDGLRDMCEVVERLTDEVGGAACRRGWLKVPEAQFQSKDWATQINELSRKEAYTPPHNPVISANLKDDLHSFRGARNLVDHKVRSRREDCARQRQFAERMMQGPRLVADLVSIKRRIR